MPINDMSNVSRSSQILVGVVLAISALVIAMYFNVVRIPVGIQSSMDPSYTVALWEDRSLVGWSDHAFVGIVRGVTGYESAPGGQVATQYEVDPILNLKGTLHENVIVHQYGTGYKHGVKFSVNDTSMLESGSAYLFLVSGPRDDGSWVAAAPEYQIVELADKDTLETSDSIQVAEGNERVREVLAAYPNEVLDGRDVQRGTAHNSFFSLDADSKASVLAMIERLGAKERAENVNNPEGPALPAEPPAIESLDASDGDQIADDGSGRTPPSPPVGF